jgi:muramoyltetrapeptide carboxypeptidase LdcA involved in peptidoglycan recycling
MGPGLSTKPLRLKPGDTVAVVSPSWGGPSVFPKAYELGLKNLMETLGVVVKEYPTARAADAFLYANPQARADDINAAFADPEVAMILASIGGEDSIRILPFIDVENALSHPKILMGFSDTATLLTLFNQHGLVTFNGPSVMAGFTTLKQMPDSFARHVRAMLMEPDRPIVYAPYEVYTESFQDWGLEDYAGGVNLVSNAAGWQWLQGKGTVRGRLFGGCIEVLEFLKGTHYWPSPDFWEDRVLFLETSEDKPSPDQVRYTLRNYGMQGVFDKIAGLLFARPFRYSDMEREDLRRQIVRVVSGEFGRPDLPIVSDMDFGHDAPQLIMPLGCEVEIDCDRKSVWLTEGAVA